MGSTSKRSCRKPWVYHSLKLFISLTFYDILSFKLLDADSKPDVIEKTPEGILKRKTFSFYFEIKFWVRGFLGRYLYI